METHEILEIVVYAVSDHPKPATDDHPAFQNQPL